MNVRLLLTAISLVCAIAAMPQHRLSAHTRAQLSAIAADEPVQVFVTCDSPASLRDVQVNMRCADMAIVTLPARQLRRFALRPGIRQVDLAHPLRQHTDASRAATQADAVLLGDRLDRAYDGTEVVLGVIDTGIDFNHLAFRDSEGHQRIERVYRPTYFGGRIPVIDGDTLPGSHFVGEAEVSALTTDDVTMNHGTHTLGIAGGSRVGAYSGMAPHARLVAVAIPGDSLTTARVLLGARYIADYARQLGLPCVISISLGDHIGSHDGTSVAARGLDEIARRYGVAIVISAGNEGNQALHLHKEFDPALGEQGMSVGTVMRTSAMSASAEVDAWSADATPFGLELQLYNTSSGESRITIPPITTDTVIDLDRDPALRQYASGTIQVRCGVDSVNSRFHIYSVFDTRQNDYRDYWAHIYRCDTVATLDAWNVDDRSQFSQMGRADWVNGDSEYSINDMATGQLTISVGSYSARDRVPTASGGFTDAPVPSGQISPSSSYGVLPDGRRLPTVAAPGVAVISSVSRYNNRSGWIFRETDQNGQTHSWSKMSGTSMSAPCVAGIIALWLQACPTLTPTQIQDIVSQTASSDAQTALNQLRWGAGKINALNGMLQVAEQYGEPTPGDVNGDGIVDVIDINLVINVMLGRATDEKRTADIDQNGVVDIIDLNQVINLMLTQ